MIYPLIRESIIKRNENFKIFSSLENDIIIIHYRYYKNTRHDDLSINQRPICKIINLIALIIRLRALHSSNLRIRISDSKRWMIETPSLSFFIYLEENPFSRRSLDSPLIRINVL